MGGAAPWTAGSASAPKCHPIGHRGPRGSQKVRGGCVLAAGGAQVDLQTQEAATRWGRVGGCTSLCPTPPRLILRPRQVSRPRGSGCLWFNSRQVCILPGQSPVQDVCSTQPPGVPGSSPLMAPPSSHPDQPRSSWGLRPGRALGPGLGVTCHFGLTVREAGAWISPVPRRRRSGLVPMKAIRVTASQRTFLRLQPWPGSDDMSSPEPPLVCFHRSLEFGFWVLPAHHPLPCH